MPAIDILVYIGLFLGLFFGIFIFLTLFENRKKIYVKDFAFKMFKTDGLPFVSLVVPCYNEEENIEGVVGSLLGLNYPKEKMEILIVDDGSKDNTLRKARLLAKQNKRIRVLHKKNGGKHTALNLALTKAKGELVGCVDADCYVEKDSLKEMLKYFEDEKTAVVVSTIKILRPGNILEGIQYAEYLISAFLKKMLSFIGSIIVAPGPLSIFRKEIFNIVGPYRKAHMTEDLEMALRLQSKNFKIANAIEAVVYTQGPSTLKELFKQRLRWRRGFLLNLKDYPHLLNLKKHGNLSFLLIYNIIGAFLSVGLASYSIYKIGNFIFQRINEAMLINFDFSPYLWDLHLPTLNFKPATILGIAAMCMMLGFLFFGKKLTFDKVRLKEKVVFYLLLYSFLNASWWIIAGFSAVFKKEVPWK